MKLKLLTLFLLATMTGKGQTAFPWLPEHKCGTWEPKPPIITDWTTVDTLGKKDHFTDLRDWKYGEEQMTLTPDLFDLVGRPCGGEEDQTWEQYRVCALTGIRQKRQRIISYKYIEPPVSDYERIVDSLIVSTQQLVGPGLNSGNIVGTFTIGDMDTTYLAAPIEHFYDSTSYHYFIQPFIQFDTLSSISRVFSYTEAVMLAQKVIDAQADIWKGHRARNKFLDLLHEWEAFKAGKEYHAKKRKP